MGYVDIKQLSYPINPLTPHIYLTIYESGPIYGLCNINSIDLLLLLYTLLCYFTLFQTYAEKESSSVL